MKILYVIPYFHPATQFGGPVSQVWAQSKAMVRGGIDVSVLTTNAGLKGSVETDKWTVLEGVKVYYARTGLMGGVTPYYAPSIKDEMERAIRDSDVIHMHVSFTFLNVWAREACRKHGKWYAYSPHGCLCPVRLQAKGLAKKLFKAFWETSIVLDAKIRIALNTEEIQHLKEFTQREELQYEQIPNGIVLDELDSGPEPGERVSTLSQFNIPNDAFVLLFMARLHPIKGVDLLVESFAKARKRNDKLQLILAGDDQGGKAIAEDVAKQTGVLDAIHFAGHVDGRKKSDLFAAADAFVLTSYSEGLPVSVLEAGAYRLPSVITTKCNVPEVQEYGGGFVCNGDSEEIANAIVELSLDADTCTSMGTNARRCVEERFSMKAVIDSTMDLYRRAGEQ